MPEYKFERQDKRIEFNECLSLILKMPDKKTKALISALYLSGARISELLYMKKDDVQYNKKDKTYEFLVISLKKRGSKKKTSFKSTRTLTFNQTSQLLDFFVDYFEEFKTYAGKNDLLFPISRQMVWYYIRKSSKNISPHSFRHSRLQKLADSGASAHQIRLFAGHSRLESSTSYIEASKFSLKPLKDLIE